MTHTAIAQAKQTSLKYRKGSVRDAYLDGFDRGYNCASWQNLPEIGETIWIDGEGKLVVDEDNQWDVVSSLAYAGESNDRQYSPFEYRASDYNSAKNADSLWEAFDAGIADGIQANVRERMAVYQAA